MHNIQELFNKFIENVHNIGKYPWQSGERDYNGLYDVFFKTSELSPKMLVKNEWQYRILVLFLFKGTQIFFDGLADLGKLDFHMFY